LEIKRAEEDTDAGPSHYAFTLWNSRK